MIVPDTHDKDHTVLHGISHSFHSSTRSESVGVTEGSFDVSAHFVGKRVILLAHGVDFSHWLIMNSSILDELSADFGQVTGLVSEELSHDADGLGGINGVGRAWSEEVFDTSTEWVQVTTVLVANTIESVVWVVTT